MTDLPVPTTSEPIIRYATENGPSHPTPPLFHPQLIAPGTDVPTILALIHELAAYERASASVLATPASLLATLTFPSNPTAGFARTLLVFPPADPHACAGMALFFPNYSTWRAAPGIYLEDLYVREAYRGRGYGTRLLRELARETERLGGKRLEWSVLRWNEPSLRFYEALGATRLEEWVGMRVEGEGLRRLAGGEEGAGEGVGGTEKVEGGAA